MTYLEFHFVFTLPPILIMLWVLRDWLGAHSRAVHSLAGIAVVAVVYTIPWDNYLVWKGVWRYGEDRVLFTIGYVPFEEYLFFVLQPLLTGLWLLTLLRRGSNICKNERGSTARWTGGTVLLAASAIGAGLLTYQGTLYLGLILAWAGPVLAGQWFYTGHWFWRARHLWLWAVSLPTVYLWTADRVALHLDIWHIAKRYTTGWHLFGLPFEEAVFFLVTNLLVVQGLLMLLRVGDAELSLQEAMNHGTSGG